MRRYEGQYCDLIGQHMEMDGRAERIFPATGLTPRCAATRLVAVD